MQKATALIVRSLAVWKEEALDDVPRKDERGPLSVTRTLGQFQRQRWENIRETG